MTKDEMRAAILEAKAEKQMTWEQIAREVGCSPVFVTSACLGENSMTDEQAGKLTGTLGLGKEVAQALMRCPVRARQGEALMTDPVIYRAFKEVGMVYGETFKELVHEKFGDGIMSAIDFTMDVEKVEDPKGDRVKIVMNGKFLPYKRW
ncbi:cyanase [Spiribacter halobius]|uniref:Cyanate hydratase n=1 Tax=Sediminicurvatus halobius TaxID=2182432 RepID=A0A2U2MYT7_9GAMM|nr:cyanase [Spiribacter halobius]PWG61967.1 cyanase [Spiribacter halobius]UEX78374.1 cyanase [Spiribacter halobius]